MPVKCGHLPLMASLILAASILASSSVKEPDIWAFPPVISDLIIGAEYGLPSKTIIQDDEDRQRFLERLGEAGDKTGWQIRGRRCGD